VDVLVAWIATHPAFFFFLIAFAASMVASHYPIDEHWGDGMR